MLKRGVGGALFAAGAFTRLTAFVLAGMMAVAYFMAHMPNSFFPINICITGQEEMAPAWKNAIESLS